MIFLFRHVSKIFLLLSHIENENKENKTFFSNRCVFYPMFANWAPENDPTSFFHVFDCQHFFHHFCSKNNVGWREFFSNIAKNAKKPKKKTKIGWEGKKKQKMTKKHRSTNRTKKNKEPKKNRKTKRKKTKKTEKNHQKKPRTPKRNKKNHKN